MENKFCDLMIANDVSKSDYGFNKDYNEVIIDKYKKINKKLKKAQKNL